LLKDIDIIKSIIIMEHRLIYSSHAFFGMKPIQQIMCRMFSIDKDNNLIEDFIVRHKIIQQVDLGTEVRNLIEHQIMGLITVFSQFIHFNQGSKRHKVIDHQVQLFMFNSTET